MLLGLKVKFPLGSPICPSSNIIRIHINLRKVPNATDYSRKDRQFPPKYHIASKPTTKANLLQKKVNVYCYISLLRTVYLIIILVHLENLFKHNKKAYRLSLTSLNSLWYQIFTCGFLFDRPDWFRFVSSRCEVSW